MKIQVSHMVRKPRILLIQLCCQIKNMIYCERIRCDYLSTDPHIKLLIQPALAEQNHRLH
jgi:hypothetical protein